MDLVSTKIVVLTLLGLIRLVCGLLPLKITKRLQLWGEQPAGSQLIAQRRRQQIERGISLCLCFGGGVLLATCFIHMLPEARESLEEVRRSPSGLLPSSSSFPFAELFICIGFFLVYIIEEIAHRVFLHTSPAAAEVGSPLSAVTAPAAAPASEKPPPPATPPHKEEATAVVTAPPQCCATVEAELDKMEANGVLQNGDVEKAVVWTRPRSTSKIAPANSQVHLLASTLSLEQKDPNGLNISASAHHHHHHIHHLPHHHHHHHDHSHPHHHHHHHHHVPPPPGEQSMMGHVRSVLVVLALSFHSVFEGLAIGLQPSQRDVWYLFTAVSIHASAILFCVGLELVTSGMRLLTMLAYVGVLAMVSPLGVALGVVVMGVGGGVGVEAGAGAGQTLAVGALQGVAGGTILYITFFEVLDREKRRGDAAGPLRLACVLAGFVVMVALQLVGGHGHGGEDSDLSSGSHNESHHHHHGTF